MRWSQLHLLEPGKLGVLVGEKEAPEQGQERETQHSDSDRRRLGSLTSPLQSSIGRLGSVASTMPSFTSAITARASSALSERAHTSLGVAGGIASEVSHLARGIAAEAASQLGEVAPQLGVREGAGADQDALSTTAAAWPTFGCASRRGGDRSGASSSEPVDAASVHKALREAVTLTPLAKPQDTGSASLEAVKAEEMRSDVLGRPALLCVIERRMVPDQRRPSTISRDDDASSDAPNSPGVPESPTIDQVPRVSMLALSPCNPKMSAWTPLVRLADNSEVLDYFLRELKLVGGLCAGQNGLTVSTVRTIYPFELCMEVIMMPTLLSEVRAAMCVLLRQLYIESPGRLLRPLPHSVWDWDALLKGANGASLPPRSACLSLPPDVVDNASDDSGADCPVTRRQLNRLQDFVSEFITRNSFNCMTSKHELELFGGVLDVTLHLLRYGHMQNDRVVERLFKKLVPALGVPQVKPPESIADSAVHGNASAQFKLALEAKSLMCSLLEAILEVRVRLRVGAVLRSIAARAAKSQVRKRNAKVVAKLSVLGAMKPSTPPTPTTAPSTSSGLLGWMFGAADDDASGRWTRLSEETDATPPPSPATPKLSTASAAGEEGDAPSSNVSIYEELRHGANVLPWQRTSEELVRSLVRTATEARGFKPDLVAGALRVLFAKFNQADVLANCVASAVICKSGTTANAERVPAAAEAAGGAEQVRSTDARVHTSECTQAILIGRTVRVLQRIVMGLKALASTDPMPAAGSMLSNLLGAVKQLRLLCKTSHQRKLQCAMGSHLAVLSAIVVLQQIEGTTEALIVDGVYRLPPKELLNAREEAFDFLAAFCGGGPTGRKESHVEYSHDHGNSTFSERRDMFGLGTNSVEGDATDSEEMLFEPANQEELFPHFSLILDHMARVRRATTCAQRILGHHARNCAAVTDEHLDQIIDLMVEGSARYSWYIDVLLSLARGLSGADCTIPLKIMRRLLAQENGYLLVLYSGAAGRERRARELASLSEAQRYADTGMISFHHALVQLLAELCSGLANEVEMHVQSIVPLHEACAHVCDPFCPYAIRASFFMLLMEGFTVTALKVQALVQSPAVWQMLAIFVSELRSLLECIAGHGDEEDHVQAALAVRPSTRGPSFVESGLWFCVGFLQKHAQPEALRQDHRACLGNLQRVAARLLMIERARDHATARIELYGGGSLFASTAGDTTAMVSSAISADNADGTRRQHLSLGPHQLTLLSAVVHTLQLKGIGAGTSSWRNTGLKLGLASVRKANAGMIVRSGKKSSDGISAHERARRLKLSATKHSAKMLDVGAPSPSRDPFSPVDARSNADSASKGNGVNAPAAAPAAGESDGQSHLLLKIENSDGGLEVAKKIAAAVKLSQPKLEAWEAEEFHKSVLIFKESEDAVRPIIDQLKVTASDLDRRDASAIAATAAIQERCLRVLQALLRAEASLQDLLNDMGVTGVMVTALNTRSTPNIFEAALELGIALLDGGNARVQRTVYRELCNSSNSALAALSHALNEQCRSILTLFLEEKQHQWYAGVLEPHLHEAKVRRSKAALLSKRTANSAASRGSCAALSNLVSKAMAHQADAILDDSGRQLDASSPKSSETPGSRLANKVLLFLECLCEGHYGEMQDFVRVQPGMRTQVNMVIDLVNNLLVLERTLSPQTISLTCQLYQTLTELVQGPCPGNQSFLIGTNLCDVAVRFMHGTYPGCSRADVIELKLLCLKLLLAMVEGVQTDIIPRRIASSLDTVKLVLELDTAYTNAGGDHDSLRVETDEQRANRDLGFYFFLLIKTLAKHAPGVLKACKERAASYEYFARSTGSLEIVRSDGDLEEVYFPVPMLCTWLSEKSKQKLEWEVDRSTPQKRVEDFVKRAEGMIHEMRHNERISHVRMLRLLRSRSEDIHMAMFVFSVIINVLILYATFPDDEIGPDGLPGAGYWNVLFRPVWVGWCVFGLGMVLVLLTIAALFDYCISELPLTLRSAWEERGVRIDFPVIWPLTVDIDYINVGDFDVPDGAESSGGAGGGHGNAGGDMSDDSKGGKSSGGPLGGVNPDTIDLDDDGIPDVVNRAMERRKKLLPRVLLWTPWLLLQQDSLLMYYLFYLTVCVLGLVASPFCFVITLLDIVPRFRILQKVIEAVTVNKESLLLTFMLVGVVIYHFTLVGQLYFRDAFSWPLEDPIGNMTSVDLCSSTADCLMNAFYLGLSYEGLAQGLADIRETWGYDPSKARIRWTVDLLFFVVVTVMLLNIIFGIVIDTFAQQRDLQNQIKDNMENVCFVCGIDRNTFDRKHPHGFDYHTEYEHNIWHYLSIVIHLRTKKQTDYTGPESYVADMLKKSDLSFFPILKTSSIVYEDQISNESLLTRVDELGSQLVVTQERLENLIEASVERQVALIEASRSQR